MAGLVGFLPGSLCGRSQNGVAWRAHDPCRHKTHANTPGVPIRRATPILAHETRKKPIESGAPEIGKDSRNDK
jgi:hypothetical protein